MIRSEPTGEQPDETVFVEQTDIARIGPAVL